MNIRYFILIWVFILHTGNSKAQVNGCTDPVAVNYSNAATVNDGSCIYNAGDLEPLSSFILAEAISETSGLIFWNEHLWTHNDNFDTNIYCLDTINGRIVKTYPLGTIANEDWEEISQDSKYIYIGDFGNNFGNRTDLKIFRISKNDFLDGIPVIDTINFSFSDQHDFSSAGAQNTDFDCEAFIVSEDSIYLFTKQWVSNKTSLYSLPKEPGTYSALLRSTLDVNGLITGATYRESERIVVLSGYSNSLDPFLYLLYDFSGHEFFGGNKRKIDLLLPFHQVESIATEDGIKYYVTNENFSTRPLISVSQKLHIFDLSPFLGNYLNIPGPHPDDENNFIIAPVPAHDFITVRSLSELLPADYILITLSGQVVMTGILTGEISTISISGLNPGVFILKIGESKEHSYKVIKE